MIRRIGLTKEALKLLLIDDHELLLRGLEWFIQTEAPDIRIVGKASTATEGFELARQHEPDVVLLDLDLTGPGALSVLVQLVTKGKPRVLVYTGVRDTKVHREAILLGARGVLLKAMDPATVLKAIRCVAKGELWLDRISAGELLTKLMYDGPSAVNGVEDPRMAKLTRRERDVVKFVSSHPGQPTKRLASSLDISEHTLRNHLSTIYRKLDVNNRAELQEVAQKAGMLSGT